MELWIRAQAEIKHSCCVITQNISIIIQCLIYHLGNMQSPINYQFRRELSGGKCQLRWTRKSSTDLQGIPSMKHQKPMPQPQGNSGGLIDLWKLWPNLQQEHNSGVGLKKIHSWQKEPCQSKIWIYVKRLWPRESNITWRNEDSLLAPLVWSFNTSLANRCRRSRSLKQNASVWFRD